MYPEFVPIYAALAVILLISVAVLVLAIIILKKVSKRFGSNITFNPSAGGSYNNTVFCKKCTAEYSVKEPFCPKCGTPRQ